MRDFNRGKEREGIRYILIKYMFVLKEGREGGERILSKDYFDS